MQISKNYDVVDGEGKLLYRGFLTQLMGDKARISKIGPFGSGVDTVDKSQLKPFNSVQDDNQPETARTRVWGV